MRVLNFRCDKVIDIPQYKNCVQGDDLKLIFSIFDNGNIANLNNHKVILKVHREDDTIHLQNTSIVINNNNVTIECYRKTNTLITQNKGRIDLELQIENLTNNFFTTFSVQIICRNSVLDTEKKQSTNTIIEALDTALKDSDYVKNDLIFQIKEGEKARDELLNVIVGSEVATKYDLSFLQRDVDVRNFGAKGDGATNDSTAFQNAINSIKETGGRVYIPKGVYKIDTTLTLYSNIVVYGEKELTVIIPPTTGYLFQASGNFTDSQNLIEDITDSNITISSTTHLSNDDIVFIYGQRDAFNVVDSKEWLLGCGTENINDCKFSEFVTVKEILSNRTFSINGSTIYNSYFKDKTRETSAFANDCTIIQKANLVKNILVKDFLVIGKSLGIFAISKGINCIANNIKMIANSEGAFIIFRQSYKCYAENCSWIGDNTNFETHYSRNVYKIISSQECGFKNCYCERGTQCFDITFDNGNGCSTLNYVDNCKTNGATYNTAIAHGGTYATSITNTINTNVVRAGISTRSKSAIIKNNTLYGSGASYGICIFERGSTNCIIADNIVRKFYSAITIEEVSVNTDEQCFKFIGLKVLNNTISNCSKGFTYNKSNSNTYNGYTGITISGNTFCDNIDKTYIKLIHLLPNLKGVDINNNIFNGSPISNALIYLEAGCTECSITNNKFYNSTTLCIWLVGNTDTTIKSYINLLGNEFYNCNSKLYKSSNVMITDYPNTI